jgi:hypothetical protein
VTGIGIWNYIFDLLSCPHVAIKVRAIHFLGLSLSGQHGEIDPRQVLQFEKIQGFASLAARVSEHSGGDTEALTEGLLSLFFWRRAVRVGGAIDSGGVPSAQNPLFGLDVIDEVESLAGTSEPQRSRQNTMDYENQRNLAEAVVLALSESDQDHSSLIQDKAHENSHVDESQPVSDNDLLDPLAKGEVTMFEELGAPTVAPTFDPSQSPPPPNSSGGFLSMFSWMGKSEGNLDGRLSNEDSRPELTKRETGGEAVGGVVADKKEVASDQKFGSKMGKLRVKAEVIVLPQILQSILSVLQNENSSERVLFAMNAIESSLTPLTVCNGSGHDTIDQESFERCARNAEVLYGQKEWLLWVCDCLLCYQRRFSQGNLHDVTSGSGSHLEYESASGLESGDDSCDGSSHHTSSRNANRILSPVPGLGPFSSSVASCHLTTLDKFNDPLLNTIQAAFVFDIPQKPSTTRKIFDIFRLPVPEARDIQILVLFDLVELFEKQSLSVVSMEPTTTLNLMKNMSTLLDQVLEKSEITLEFCVRAIHAMNSLIYHAPQDIRLKIKDTLLFDVKHAYVMRCLVDRQEDIWERVSCLSSIHSSIIDLISTGIPNRTLQDHNLFVLFLDIFLQACCEVYAVFDVDITTTALTEHQTNKNIKTNDTGSGSGRGGVTHIPDEYLNMQLAALVLIQNCVQTSNECKRSVEKILQTEFSEDQREILSEAFCNSYGTRRGCSTPVNEDEQHASNLSTGGMSSVSPSSSFNKPSGSWWSSWSSSVPDTAIATTVTSTPINGSVSLSSSENSVGQHLLGGEDLQEEKVVTDIETGKFPQEGELTAGDELTAEEQQLYEQRPEDITNFLHWLNRIRNRECIDILVKKVAKFLPALYQKTDKIQVSNLSLSLCLSLSVSVSLSLFVSLSNS